jgi:hypothetical protein
MSGCDIQLELFIYSVSLFFSLNITFHVLLSFDCTVIHDVLFHPSLDLSLVALVVHSSLLLFIVTFFFSLILAFSALIYCRITIFELRLHVLAGFVWTCGRVIQCCMLFDLPSMGRLPHYHQPRCIPGPRL